MPKTKYMIDERDLSKGELRKLNALRKSIGEGLGNEAFSKWYDEQRKDRGGKDPMDPNVDIIRQALDPHLKKMSFPRGGGYTIKRGRGRVIVEPLMS